MQALAAYTPAEMGMELECGEAISLTTLND
jgi:hypothetical protein